MTAAPGLNMRRPVRVVRFCPGTARRHRRSSLLRRNPTCCDFALPKLRAEFGRLRGKADDCKIKRTWVRHLLRSQVFVCTLVFSPWTGTFSAPCKVHRVLSFVNFSLLSMPKVMTTSRSAGGDRAVYTPQQSISRCSAMASRWLLRQVNRLPMVPAWQAMTETISAFTQGAPAAGKRAPMRARSRS